MVTYQLVLNPTATLSEVLVIDGDGNEQDISNQLRGIDIKAEVGALTLVTLHGFGGVRATIGGARATWIHDDCSDCKGHDAQARPSDGKG